MICAFYPANLLLNLEAQILQLLRFRRTMKILNHLQEIIQVVGELC